ncbi:MAG TPA: class II fructose-bisphosphatase [Candidatus Sulfotelmatobacter sp.]|jgi:fructose-1,6-bisphosphatase II / sedoheptulose-1,7-bisphosphatase|nr:class II fructose-bisphosphatase [Candidatus Sulfotelmatobacter sp.]
MTHIPSQPDCAAIDRNLALEAVRVTEATALAASRLVGCGDERLVEAAATSAMETALGALSIGGTILFGEGSQDDAPRLYTGQKIGLDDGSRVDVALDAIEGTTICAKGGSNVISVLAMAEQGGLLNVPPVYMEKIAVGPGLPDGVVELDASPADNLSALARAKGCDVSDLLICILDRPRHDDLIHQVREAGARIILIGDGDVSGVVATTQLQSGVDMYIGTGAAPEGVLAAAALACIGGQMQGRLVLRGEADKQAARALGITDFKRKYNVADLAHGDVMFAATGVTDGPLLRGIRRFPGGSVSHSLVMRSHTGTIRYIEAVHNFHRKSLLNPIGQAE